MPFGKKPGAKPPSPPPPPEPPAAGTEQKPAASAKTGATPDAISARLLDMFENAYADEQGRVHVETLLSALGACAGFGCQIAVREAIKAGRLDPKGALVMVETQDGGTYFFGDQINQPLLEAPVSVWRLIAGAAQHAGAKEIPDIIEIVTYVTKSIGGGEFGVLRAPPQNQPHLPALKALQGSWRTAYATIWAMEGEPIMTGWYFAGAAQRVIVQAKDIIDPALAFSIVMESAVMMAKVDPKLVGYDPDRGPLLQD